jgi:hypothetical protein
MIQESFVFLTLLIPPPLTPPPWEEGDNDKTHF